ncbi:hypothetical protein [Williamsoniiplasma lucivorax]|uniref:Uncharacterized protein n=1 Tax=Williamsoniiplasma lucivorax TaxID=209274 RepID=A0A2S5RAJ2_9MOLU|nr:hypothetical protein [Williamsoniiplasma lucivorax]PPE04310.1 hypothetical protein ELUCI_v1c08310 [Williamsoniiplasma lucivorax]
MDKWKIETDQKNRIHIKKNNEGNFINKHEAVRLGQKMAKDNKAILLVHDQDDKEKKLIQFDYTNFLSPEEMYGKQISEMRIARAELVVAKVEIRKRKKQLKNSDKEERMENKNKVIFTRERFQKAKINFKNAKKKFKEMKKSQEKSDY